MSEGASRRGKGLPLRAVDWMILAFLAFLAAVAAATHPRPLPILAGIGSMSGALLCVVALRARFALARYLHDFYPLPAVITIFNLAGPLIGTANAARWDATFAAADERLFGPLAAAWRQVLGRPGWLTDLASLVYVSYYLIPVVMAVALYARGRAEEFDASVLGFISTLLLSYLGYFLFPTTGPRVPLELEAEVLGGGAVSAGVRAFLRFAEVNQLDAFPSGHTALSLVFLAYGWRLFPRWRAPLLLATAGIIFSTVYLSLHYVVDLCAGAAQAFAMAAVIPALRRGLGRRPAASLEGPALP